MNTNKLTKIEELQIENAKLNERLDNCARQFKKMMQRIDELEAKQNNTSTNQDSSTTSSIQEKSNSKPSNPSSGTTTHQEDLKPTESKEIASKAIVEDDAHAKEDEEKPTEGKEMPLNEKKLRYLDTMTNKQYATKQEAQKDGVNPRFLYDFKIGGCLWSYEDEDEDDASIDDTSTVQEKTSTIEENPSNGITTQPNEEKPTVAQQIPSMTIVTDNVTSKKEEKAVEEEKKHMYFFKLTTLTDEILNELKKNYSTSECLKLFKIDLVNHTIVSKTSRDILGYGEESRELKYRIAMDSKEGKRLMKMVAIGV